MAYREGIIGKFNYLLEGTRVYYYTRKQRKHRYHCEEGETSRYWYYDWKNHIQLTSLESSEGDNYEPEGCWLGRVPFEKVVIPPEPDWCGNCIHGDTGNHGDESAWCQLYQYSVGRELGCIKCVSYKSTTRRR